MLKIAIALCFLALIILSVAVPAPEPQFFGGRRFGRRIFRGGRFGGLGGFRRLG